jgi:hypothetical protein
MEDGMGFLELVAWWLALSIPFGIFAGKFVAFGSRGYLD